MALKIEKPPTKEEKAAAEKSALVADRRLYLSRDEKRVVDEGDPAAAFLFAVKGDVVSAEQAQQFGLQVKDGRIQLAG